MHSSRQQSLADVIEGLGVFYLGTRLDDTGERTGEPVLVDARRFTTHAVCVGMTGSGKTGLLVGLIEEAALDGIPTLVIDPKGDLANVLLTFPSLAPADFAPWVDPEAARREGISSDELAARTASKWSEGLAASGQSGDRITRLREAADFAIYTPGSTSGIPLAMLGTMDAPPEAILADPEARRERIESLVSGILALAGINADPGTSREHVLLAAIIDHFWTTGQKVDFGTLIRTIPTPPIDRIGFLDLENFYSAGDRFQLATRLNTVAAAPGFEAWLEGEPLDVGRLLWSPAGKPRVAVISIAHLTDAQRMAFVTLLAGQTISWMRSQPGTSSLKALFLMDEVFGYVPPVANPPSKTPILTLMKQARAYGLGVVLATQNPVDLDYKGLANAGLWFLGRLQTARDKARVLDGLEGAAASSGGSFDRARLDRLLSGLEQRRFLMHSVHGDDETLFQSRWTMSYLRGPLMREEIRQLVGEASAREAPASPPVTQTSRPSRGGPRPILPPGIREVFLSQGASPSWPRSPRPTDGFDGRQSLDSATRDVVYAPHILARAIVRYSLASAGIEEHREQFYLAPAPTALGESAWEAATLLPEAPQVEAAPHSGTFATLPPVLAGPRGYAALATALKNFLARSSKLSAWRAPALGEYSRPDEPERAFRLRIAHQAHEKRDAEIEKLRARHASKMASLDDRIERARQKVERETAQAKDQSMQTYVSIGSAVLDALLGRKKISSRTIGKAATSMRSASRATRQQADVAHAEESLQMLEERRRELEAEIDRELEAIRLAWAPEALAIEPIEIPARKTDTTVEEVVLAWVDE